jgi:hypothetical protein
MPFMTSRAARSSISDPGAARESASKSTSSPPA